MPSLIHRIRSSVLEFGRGANEQLDLLFRSSLANPLGFRREASSSELKLRSNGRSDFRRFERVTASPTGPTTVTMTASQHLTTFLCDTAVGIVVFELPAPADGLIFTFKDATGGADTYPIEVQPNASEKINNVAASKYISGEYGGFTLYSNGTDWFTVDEIYSEPGNSQLTSKNVAVGSGTGIDPGSAGVLLITSGDLVKGIVAPSPARPRELVVMMDGTSENMILYSESTDETTAANRIFIKGVSPHTSVNSAHLVYNTAASRWICVARS